MEYSNMIWLSAGWVVTCKADISSSMKYTVMVRLSSDAWRSAMSASLACNGPWAHAARGFPPTAFLIRRWRLIYGLRQAKLNFLCGNRCKKMWKDKKTYIGERERERD